MPPYNDVICHKTCRYAYIMPADESWSIVFLVVVVIYEIGWAGSGDSVTSYEIVGNMLNMLLWI